MLGVRDLTDAVTAADGIASDQEKRCRLEFLETTNGSITGFHLFAAWLDLLQQFKQANVTLQKENIDFPNVARVTCRVREYISEYPARLQTIGLGDRFANGERLLPGHRRT